MEKRRTIHIPDGAVDGGRILTIYVALYTVIVCSTVWYLNTMCRIRLPFLRLKVLYFRRLHAVCFRLGHVILQVYPFNIYFEQVMDSKYYLGI